MSNKIVNFFWYFCLRSIILTVIIDCAPLNPEIIHDELTEESDELYSIAEVTVPIGRAKREAKEYLQVTVTHPKKNRTEVLNLKKVDNMLADINTLVWQTETLSYNIRKERFLRDIDVMNNIGEFTLYQSYDQKAAVILFHKENMLRGYVKNSKFLPLKSQAMSLDNNAIQKYNLSPLGANNGVRMSPIAANNYPKPVPLRTPPNTVYPELLVVMDDGFMRNIDSLSIAERIKDFLIYFNAIDMLYGNIKTPRIKFHISGIVYPMNKDATPWVNERNSDNSPKSSVVMEHFRVHNGDFPEHSYDYIITFASTRVTPPDDPSSHALGKSTFSPACDDKNDRVAFIFENLNDYVTGAHEIAHLMGAAHDEGTSCESYKGIMAGGPSYTDDDYIFSTCTQDDFTAFFSEGYSSCLDNRPGSPTTNYYSSSSGRFPSSRGTSLPTLLHRHSAYQVDWYPRQSWLQPNGFHNEIPIFVDARFSRY